MKFELRKAWTTIKDGFTLKGYIRSFFKDYDPSKPVPVHEDSHALWLNYARQRPDDIANTYLFKHIGCDEAMMQKYLSTLTEWNRDMGYPVQLTAAPDASLTLTDLIDINQSLIRATVERQVAPTSKMLDLAHKQHILAQMSAKMSIPTFRGHAPSKLLSTLSTLSLTDTESVTLATVATFPFILLASIGIRAIWPSILPGDVVMLSIATVALSLISTMAIARYVVFNKLITGLLGQVSETWDGVFAVKNDAHSLLLALLVEHAPYSRSDVVNRIENFSGWTPREVMQYLLAEPQLGRIARETMWAPYRDNVSIQLPDNLLSNIVEEPEITVSADSSVTNAA